MAATSRVALRVLALGHKEDVYTRQVDPKRRVDDWSR
jgi:hypothetical protein